MRVVAVDLYVVGHTRSRQPNFTSDLHRERMVTMTSPITAFPRIFTLTGGLPEQSQSAPKADLEKTVNRSYVVMVPLARRHLKYGEQYK